VASLSVDGFICPLCLRSLPDVCGTIAHAPAESVGGKPVTFLCKACNNFLGTTYEAGLSGWIERQREARTSGTATHKATLRHGDGTLLYADASFAGPNGIKAQIRGGNRPAQSRFGAEAKAGVPLKISFRQPGEANLKLGYLAWGYLQLFARVGYSFVLSEAAMPAREALLTRSVRALGPAFFMISGQFDGGIAPVVTGIVLRLSPIGDMALAVGVRFGGVFIALPMTDDPDDRYGRLAKYVGDHDLLIVAPFDDFYPGQSALDKVADFRYETVDHRRLRVVGADREAAIRALSRAAPPPELRLNAPRQDWLNPPTLTLPPEPRADTWRWQAADYLARLSIQVLPSATPDDDERWIEDVRRIDPVAGAHVFDMRRLFRDRADPRAIRGPSMARWGALIDQLEAPYASIKATITMNAQIILPGEEYVCWSARIALVEDAVVVGPYYSYATLALAIDRVLATAASAAESSSLTTQNRPQDPCS
jgi:hypothetical protein